MSKPVAVTIGVLASLLAIGLSACGGSGSGKEGGTLKVTYASFPEHMDPQLSFSAEGWAAMGEVYIPLLTYKHASGKEGSEVVPGLAKEMPRIGNGGKTYTLFLRPGLVYSDGTPVRASDFRYAVERLFRLDSSASPFYTSIVGAEEFAKTKRGGISGIKTNDKTGEVRIDLTEPRGTFTNELAMLWVALVPKGTPNEDLSADPPPGTGPYMITSSNPGRGWEYARNPQWAKVNSAILPDYPSGHMDKVVVDVVRNPQAQVDDIEKGVYDWMENPPPASRLAGIKQKYEGTRFRVEPTISTYYFWLNTSKPPFDDLKVRQAVNYALNTEALERIYAGSIVGAHQILPPGMPGYEKLDLYPYDMAKARRLLKEADPSDMDITVWTDNESPNNEAGEYWEGVLKKLGFNAKLKTINADNYFTVIGNHSTPDLDTGWGDWFQDYPHPNDFFQLPLSGESIMPTNNSNLSNIDEPQLNEKINRLRKEQLGPRQEDEYAALDREYMELAPWAPYGTRTLATFVSDRIDFDKVIFSPTFSQYLTSFELK